VIGVPLTDNAAFYGRQDFFHFIQEVLGAEKQNVIVLYGQRRIGKTSVLHQAGKWLEGQGVFFPVYYDLQGKEGMRLGPVLANLAQTLARRIDLVHPDPASFDDAGVYFRERFLPQAFQRLGTKRLVLLIDEFDVLSDELESPRAASKTLFPYLQDLIVTRPQVGFVFVVGRRIEELATHFQAIFKQAVYRRVGHLKTEESRALIVEPARGTLTYADDAILKIQSLTTGHPYFTQLICFEVFNAAKASGTRTVTAEVVESVVRQAIESGHGALNWFWEGLPRAERFILSAVAQASDSSGVASKDAIRRLLEEHRIQLSGLELNDAPNRLVEWEMLRREGPDAYLFVVEVVRRWVVQEHPLSSARRDIDYVSKRAVRLFENARDAHAEGDLKYARDEYRRTLNANPNHSGAQLGLALVLFELGEIDEAIAEFERAYAIDEMSARDGLMRARLVKAKLLEEQHDIDAAANEYLKVLKLASTEETANRRLGAIWLARAAGLLSTKKLAAAGAAFREMLRYDRQPETVSRMRTLFVAYARECEVKGEIERGLQTFVLLGELLPHPEEALADAIGFGLRSGDALIAKGQLDAAVEFFKRLKDLYPGNDNIAARLELARKKVEERQNIDRIFNQALGAQRSGDINGAREGFKKLIQMDVLTYKDRNVPMLLAETVTMPAEPRPAQHSAKQQPSGTPASREAAVRFLPNPTAEPAVQPLKPRVSRAGRRILIAAAVIGVLLVIGYLNMSAGIRPSTAGPPLSPDEEKGTTTTTPGSWDVPRMKANVTDLRFFAAKSEAAPDRPQRKYEPRLNPKKDEFIFAELSIDIDEAARERSLDAKLSYRLTRSDGSLAEEYSWTLEVPRTGWHVVIPIRLDFSNGMTPDTYHIEFQHDGKVIRTATFEVI
jgi:tetratricopeptide (TPR) repeat protein